MMIITISAININVAMPIHKVVRVSKSNGNIDDAVGEGNNVCIS